VKTLRQYSLPSALEGDIEGYLTDVLDQMDLLQSINTQNKAYTPKKEETDSVQLFSQLNKPQGDEEIISLEETLRDATPRLNVASPE